MAITMIVGEPRAGKTAYMTANALPFMHGVNAHRDLRSAHKLIDPLEGLKYDLPQDHLVFADYTICADVNAKNTNYEIDGFYLGLAQEVHPTLFLPPYSRLFLDEAQKYFNSRDSAKLADFVSRFYELHGHYRLNIMLTVQRPKLIDLNVRELAAKVVYVESLEHEKIGRRVVRSQWTLNVYDNVAAAIQYIDGGQNSKLRGDRELFTYDGNIFRHYDSYAFFPAFLRERYDEQFDLRKAVICGKTRAEIEDFNDQHDYIIPETYFKQSKTSVAKANVSAKRRTQALNFIACQST